MSNLKRFNRAITDAQMQDYLIQVLGNKKNSFVNNLTALVSNNEKLQECEPLSLMYAGIKATALDLPLDQNLGFAYVIPYKNNKKTRTVEVTDPKTGEIKKTQEAVTEAQFQIGYKGFVQLAIRSSQFQNINVTEIKEGELVNEDLLTGEISFKRAENRESLPTAGYAAYFRLTNGFTKMLYMNVERMQHHAGRYSQTYSSKNNYIRENSKWNTDFDAMAKKTVLKLLLSKYAPLSVEMQQAVINDQAVLTEKGATYVDNGQPAQQDNIEDAAAEFLEEEKNAKADTKAEANPAKTPNAEPSSNKKSLL
jgi:recombination protein RecT